MIPVVPLCPEGSELPCSVQDLPHAWGENNTPCVNGYGIASSGAPHVVPPIKHHRKSGQSEDAAGLSTRQSAWQPGPQMTCELRTLLQVQHQELMRRLEAWMTERDDKMDRSMKIPLKIAQPKIPLRTSPSSECAWAQVHEQSDSRSAPLEHQGGPGSAQITSDVGPQRRTEMLEDVDEEEEYMVESQPAAECPPSSRPTVKEKVGPGLPWRVRLQKFLAGNGFEVTCGITIVSNALFMGVEIDYTAAHLDETPPWSFFLIGYTYTVLFTLELILKILADRCFFFCPEQPQQIIWNYLDLIIVMSSLGEVVLDIISAQASEDSTGGGSSASVDNLRIIRIVRLSRLMRLCRIGRIVRFVRSLRMLVMSILSTLKSVFWSMLLLAIIMYVFAMLFTQAASDYQVSVKVGGVTSVLDPSKSEKLKYHWGNLGDAILTLFMSICGGVSWIEVMVPLREVSPLWMFVFLAYISFTYFAVLNVVTGVFCQSAIESTQYDQDAMIQAFLMNKQVYTSRFEALFKSLDTDQSGIITKDEFMTHIHDDKVQAFFASLELEASDAIQLFRMIDDDDANAGIDIEDFVVGCLRLKGSARSCDIARLMFDNKALARDITDLWEYLEDQFRVLCGHRAVSPGPRKAQRSTSMLGIPSRRKQEQIVKAQGSVSALGTASVELPTQQLDVL